MRNGEDRSNTLDINKLTIGEAKQIAATFCGTPLSSTPANHSFEIGKAYFFQTVTLYFTGRIDAITDTDIVISEAAWIADTGRFADFIKDCEKGAPEVEPMNRPYILSRSGIIGAIDAKTLPRSQR